MGHLFDGRPPRPMWNERRMTFLAFVIGLLIGGDIFLGAQLHATITDNCSKINLVVHAIKGTVKRSETLLGTKGSAGYAYYKVHPDELIRTKLELKHEYDSFQFLRC